MYRPTSRLLASLTCLVAFLCATAAARAEVSSAASELGGAIDTLPPRVEALTPGANELYLRLGGIYFSWQVAEPHRGAAGPLQRAEVIVADVSADTLELSPEALFGEWTWTAPEGPAATARLRLTLTDAFGNQTQAFGERFTLLPSTSPVDDGAPRATRLVGAHPNPFNPSTKLRFELAEAQDVRLEIFDVRGRRVRTLAAREFEAGVHEIEWDATDDAGRALAGGTYVVRLGSGRDGRVLSTRKAVLLP